MEPFVIRPLTEYDMGATFYINDISQIRPSKIIFSLD